MSKTYTLDEINGALEDLALMMADCDEAHLIVLSSMYAKAYTIKLQLMKEKPHASH
jgi:hypothetical protein